MTGIKRQQHFFLGFEMKETSGDKHAEATGSAGQGNFLGPHLVVD